MKKIILYLLTIVSCALMGQQAFGKITLPLGMVEVSKDNNTWVKAKPRQSVYEGNVIRTKAKIQVNHLKFYTKISQIS
tara:strand:- start:258 stop:491 length:234 start_codon:yes stop_codon:yes gene_type:complete